MKNIGSILAVCTFMLLCGCTQYNGHIGPIFGSWSLVSIKDNGLPVELGDETVFSFQNEVVRVVRLVDTPYTTVTRYGNFTLTDDILTLKFMDGPTATGVYMYTMPDWLHFPSDDGVIKFDVMKLNGSEMELRVISEDASYVYSFKKTW